VNRPGAPAGRGGLRLRLSHASLIAVRKLARLALFFTLGFAALFLAMAGMRFLALRLDWASGMRGAGPPDPAEAARWALALALYGGTLLGLAYAAIERVFAPAAILCVLALSLAFSAGIGRGLEGWAAPPAAAWPAPELGSPGLILGAQPRGTAIVFLQGPGEPARSRVLAVPGSPLVFQEEFAGLDRSLVAMPPALFNSEPPWALRSAAIDLRLSAENMRRGLSEGLPSFLLHTGALAFMLTSLLFVLRLSAWPLANFFLGALAFRGALALEAAMSNDLQGVFAPFLEGRMDPALAAPAVFLAVGLLAHLYSLFSRLARRQARHAEA